MLQEVTQNLVVEVHKTEQVVVQVGNLSPEVVQVNNLVPVGNQILQGLSTKSGEVLPIELTGVPPTADVVFSNPLLSPYTVTANARTLDGCVYAIGVSNVTSTGFTLHLNSSRTARLDRLFWQVIEQGEYP